MCMGSDFDRISFYNKHVLLEIKNNAYNLKSGLIKTKHFL